MSSSNPKKIWPLIVLGMALGIAWLSIIHQHAPPLHHILSYSGLVHAAEHHQVVQARITGDTVEASLLDGENVAVQAPKNTDIATVLVASGADVRVNGPTEPVLLLSLILDLLPPLFLGGILFLFFKGGAGGRLMGLRRSRVQLLVRNESPVLFSDVAGVEEAVQDLKEIVAFLKDPQRYATLGAQIPKGVLLVGPPGTGKTRLAQAVAGEAKVPFFSASGSEFVEMLVGVGASRVRDMFEQAKKHAPCIIFIDEIDAMGRQRGAVVSGGNEEREHTLNQMLVEMDGFSGNSGVILIGATNRPDVLDPALLRPGRFDRQIILSNPDAKGRLAILNIHVQRVPMSNDVDLIGLARVTPGFSGAELRNLVNEAALTAAGQRLAQVGMGHFLQARDKVMMGPERRSLVLRDEERRLSAYHEAGHAVLAICLPDNDPLDKISIVPRGQALGVTVSYPLQDRHAHYKHELLARLIMLYGGRAAEALILGQDRISNGASSDIREITILLRRMIGEWGMDADLGAIRYTQDAGPWHDVLHSSSQTEQLIDIAVQSWAKSLYQQALDKLDAHREALDRIALALLEYETLDGQEAMDLFSGKAISRQPL